MNYRERSSLSSDSRIFLACSIGWYAVHRSSSGFMRGSVAGKLGHALSGSHDCAKIENDVRYTLFRFLGRGQEGRYGGTVSAVND